ncbi:MAG: cob(I)yrinic acid a,c-diamide adenosyltransferase [Chloroflexota bacterium]|nr:cob(I)yrinic acid a,c-diamide adenosyltransferase [Chloroflexota bacterium]
MTETGHDMTVGDTGDTDLLGGALVHKWDLRPETYSTIDEATSALGLARALATEPAVREAIHDVQQDLHQLMAELATPVEDEARLGFRVTDEHIAKIERRLEEAKGRVAIGNQFIIPGATVPGAALDLARTIVRRAERDAARLAHEGGVANPAILRYLNRLSDLVFVLARLEEHGGSEPVG